MVMWWWYGYGGSGVAMSECCGQGKVCTEPVEEQVKEESGMPWVILQRCSGTRSRN